MADVPLPAVRPPELVYRVARGLDVFAPPAWAYALPDGTFGNRFDDPSAEKGVPEEERYQAIYCVTERAGAFGETIARFRPSIELLAGLEAIEDDEPLDPELRGGVVPEEWRLSRRVGSTRLVPDLLLFADLPAPETMRVLREELAPYPGSWIVRRRTLGSAATHRSPPSSARRLSSLLRRARRASLTRGTSRRRRLTSPRSMSTVIRASSPPGPSATTRPHGSTAWE